MRNESNIGETRVPAELVSYELVALERRGAIVEAVVRGMSSSIGLEAIVYDRRGAIDIAMVGVPSVGEVRPYEVRAIVEIRGDHDVAVRGLNETVSIAGSSLPDALPVVFGADPTQAGMVGDFLHRRGDRYVLMHGSDGLARDRHQFTKVA